MEERVSRRRFMVGAGAATFLAACADGDWSGGDAASGRTTITRGGRGPGDGAGGGGAPNHFRLSSRHSRRKPCNACLSHANSRYYATAEAAEADRPHAGCHCQVRGRVAPDSEIEEMFGGGSRDVYDSRAG